MIFLPFGGFELSLPKMPKRAKYFRGKSNIGMYQNQEFYAGSESEEEKNEQKNVYSKFPVFLENPFPQNTVLENNFFRRF